MVLTIVIVNIVILAITSLLCYHYFDVLVGIFPEIGRFALLVSSTFNGWMFALKNTYLMKTFIGWLILFKKSGIGKLLITVWSSAFAIWFRAIIIKVLWFFPKHIITLIVTQVLITFGKEKLTEPAKRVAHKAVSRVAKRKRAKAVMWAVILQWHINQVDKKESAFEKFTSYFKGIVGMIVIGISIALIILAMFIQPSIANWLARQVDFLLNFEIVQKNIVKLMGIKFFHKLGKLVEKLSNPEIVSIAYKWLEKTFNGTVEAYKRICFLCLCLKYCTKNWNWKQKK